MNSRSNPGPDSDAVGSAAAAGVADEGAAGAADEAPGGSDAGDRAPADDMESTRAAFRAALERKKQRNAAGFGGGIADPQARGAHAAQGGKRVFRRKSG